MRDLCVVVVTILTLASGQARVASAGDEFGALLVESDPIGASVYIDGRLAGETPLTLPAIAAGAHRVRLVRLGFLENSRVVTITSGARVTMRARLTDPAPQTAQAAALKIVVLQGEGAVNIIQQQTAVAPVIQVRDRNDQPVSSAVVKFAIRGRQATFNGARTLTVTTDAAGRAAVTSLTPTGTGALHITATAAFQGQTAVATIAQTNVLTAAQAASMAGASAGGSGSAAGAGASAGGAGGGGGGLSGTTIGVVGGAVAGGTIAVKKLTSDTPTVYAGDFSGVMVWMFNPGATCTVSTQFIGRLEISVLPDEGGVKRRTTTADNIAATCVGVTLNQPGDALWNQTPEVRVSGANVSVHAVQNQGPTALNWDFAGTVNGDVLTGTLTFSMVRLSDGLVRGTLAIPMTLNKQ